MTPVCINLKEAAKFLGIGYSTARRDWASWQKFGVVPSRYQGNPKSNLMFRIADLNRLLDAWRVQ